MMLVNSRTDSVSRTKILSRHFAGSPGLRYSFGLMPVISTTPRLREQAEYRTVWMSPFRAYIMNRGSLRFLRRRPGMPPPACFLRFSPAYHDVFSCRMAECNSMLGTPVSHGMRRFASACVLGWGMASVCLPNGCSPVLTPFSYSQTMRCALQALNTACHASHRCFNAFPGLRVRMGWREGDSPMNMGASSSFTFVTRVRWLTVRLLPWIPYRSSVSFRNQ